MSCCTCAEHATLHCADIFVCSCCIRTPAPHPHTHTHLLCLHADLPPPRRQLNEALYTQPGDNSFSTMQQQPELFTQYHEGFQQQVKAWPSQPLDAAISWLKGKPQDWVVADFGCGEARLAATVKQVGGVVTLGLGSGAGLEHVGVWGYGGYCRKHRSSIHLKRAERKGGGSAGQQRNNWGGKGEEGWAQDWVVADLGCGEARLVATVKQVNKPQRSGRGVSAATVKRSMFVWGFGGGGVLMVPPVKGCARGGSCEEARAAEVLSRCHHDRHPRFPHFQTLVIWSLKLESLSAESAPAVLCAVLCAADGSLPRPGCCCPRCDCLQHGTHTTQHQQLRCGRVQVGSCGLLGARTNLLLHSQPSPDVTYTSTDSQVCS